MGRRKDERARVRGPYRHRDGWYVETIDPQADRGDGKVRSRYFGTEEDAEVYKQVKAAQLERLHGVSFDTALTEYKKFLTTTGHKKVSSKESAEETCRRLRLFFEDVLEHRLAKVDDERAGELYTAFTQRTYTVGSKKAPREKPYTPGHHRNVLAQAQTFMRWCVRPRKWITFSPLDDVRGVGSVNAGKPQLHGDEAARFYQWCAYKIGSDDHAALALAMLLLMMLRQGDVRKRVVRDVDLDGTVLRTSKTKSKKGDRGRRIPEVLRAPIAKLIKNRDPLEPLFKSDKGGFHTKTWLLIAAKRLCVEAGVPLVTPHGLKGTAASLASDDLGVLPDVLATALSHESSSISRQSYIADGAAENAIAATALKVITGGKR